MNFQLTEEQIAVQMAARDFAKNELLPGVIERDDQQKFATDQIKKLGEFLMGSVICLLVDLKQHNLNNQRSPDQ